MLWICPVYSVTIFEDVTVIYEGKKHVENIDTYQYDNAIPVVVAGAFTAGVAFFILKKQWIKQSIVYVC